MDNLLSPAYPLVASLDEKENKYFTVADMDTEGTGFTKLELASLMIAQGIVMRKFANPYADQNHLAETAVSLAKIVLKEANK